MENIRKFSGDAWYNAPGEDDDVVVSSRVRLARNLSDFAFPENFEESNAISVQNIVFDSFNHFEDAEIYQSLVLSSVPEIGAKILQERGIFDGKFGTGIVMRIDGISSCLLNSIDHLRISSFAPGLACNGAYISSNEIDIKLQERIQFAATEEFGYLTARAVDSGSGMKTSIRVHLPSLSYSEKARDIADLCEEKGYSLSASFGSGNLFGSSLGAFYDIASTQSVSGSEIDQLAGITSLGKHICETERREREAIAEKKETQIRDIVFRAYATMKFCLLMELREAIELISVLKWGLDLGFVKGLSDYEISSLLYKVQSGHVEFLLRTQNQNFDYDVDDDLLKEKRLRAIIMQESFKKMSFVMPDE